MDSLQALQKVRDTDIFVDFETDYHCVNDILKDELDTIEEDLEMLKILKDYLFFSPSFFVDQGHWENEYISMSYLDKTWTPKEIFEKVKQWCFKNKIRGTNDENHD